MTDADQRLVHVVTHSARKAGARIQEVVEGNRSRFVFHGPNGEVNAGEYLPDRKAALVSACKSLWEARPR